MDCSRFIGALSSLLFLAVCAYAGAYLYPGAGGGETAVLCSASVTESVELRGIAVRSEQMLTLPRGGEFAAESGKRLPCGGLLAKSARETVTAPSSSVFFDRCDGFEALSPQDLFPLTVSSVDELLARKPEAQADGRLVLSTAWYFAAVSDSAALPTEGSCRVLFDAATDPVEAYVVALSEEEGGQRAILLRLTAGGDTLLSLRQCSARLIVGEYSGLKAPEAAVRQMPDGTHYVNTIAAGSMESTAVDIIYSAEGFCLIAPVGSSDLLRDGSRVTVG